MPGLADATDTRTEKGISLARGPALVLGTILLAAGLYFLYKQHGFPPLSKFPNGHAPVDGKVFLGIFGANGWTGMLTAVAGGLLLFGAAQHLLAKAMSLIVGVALGAAAIIALISGNVLGLAAANDWTKLGWGASAVILLFNTVVPRRRKTVETVDQPAGDHEPPAGAEAAGTGVVAGAAIAGDRESHASRGGGTDQSLVRPADDAGTADSPPASTATGEPRTSVMRDHGRAESAPSAPATPPGERPA